MTSHTEENYLKAIFKLAEKTAKAVSTNAIAAEMRTSAASVTDMLKRLAEKELIHYEKYRGVQLTEQGSQLATALIRKHRLWEVFLVDKLGFAWDEVHDLAEQLEHVQGSGLVERLDTFLGRPKFDPHGDPIPDAEGRWAFRQQVALNTLQPGDKGVVTGVDEHSTEFLQYLDQLGLALGARLELLERYPYDQSVRIRTADGRELTLSEKVGQNLYVKVS
ncbi:MAG: metal-dependent transcriptional regulator [Bacteroidetes bacterium]|nr:MAG: metal-dependent transcriptional regulator [Bacteroidota bacterium]